MLGFHFSSLKRSCQKWQIKDAINFQEHHEENTNMRILHSFQKTVFVLILAIMLTSGCATQPNSQESSTASEGAIIGALVCGVIGGAVCRGDPSCILAGIAVCGGAGFLIGIEIAKRQQKYASIEDFYDAQTISIHELNRAIIWKNQELRRSIQNDQRRINMLIEQYSIGRASRVQLTRFKWDIRKKQNENQQILKGIKNELALQKEVLNRAEQQGQNQGQQIWRLRNQVSKLSDNINMMQQHVDQQAALPSMLYL